MDLVALTGLWEVKPVGVIALVISLAALWLALRS
ncbi:hypothetical protein LCGC14_1177460 [marine sediment metagenome]|uniref:Uncharacterized protein n=1 Tax=marine sediment metagenome TaxID=412755 RepID=A0A0F9MAX2_9ZZZZ